MPGVGSAFLCPRTDGHWWKPASLMVRLTHISDWPMHVAYWGTQWLLNTSWLDPVRAIDSRRSQHVSKAGHLVMTAPLRPPAPYYRGARGHLARRQDGPILYFASYAAEWWYTSSQVAATANAEPQFWHLVELRLAKPRGQTMGRGPVPEPVDRLIKNCSAQTDT